MVVMVKVHIPFQPIEVKLDIPKGTNPFMVMELISKGNYPCTMVSESGRILATIKDSRKYKTQGKFTPSYDRSVYDRL